VLALEEKIKIRRGILGRNSLFYGMHTDSPVFVGNAAGPDSFLAWRGRDCSGERGAGPAGPAGALRGLSLEFPTGHR
jgi:hypothetical protein